MNLSEIVFKFPFAFLSLFCLTVLDLLVLLLFVSNRQ